MAQMGESVAPQLGAEETRDQRRREAKAYFVRLGTTMDAWARENGFRPGAVYKVLSGEVKARRGISHEIAVRLGIKDGELPGKGADHV